MYADSFHCDIVSVSWKREYSAECRSNISLPRAVMCGSPSLEEEKGGTEERGNECLVGEMGRFNRVTVAVELNQYIRRHFRYFDYRS